MGEASIKVYRGLERVYNEIGRDLSANLLTISTDKTPFAINSRLVGNSEANFRVARDSGKYGPKLPPVATVSLSA